MCFASLTDFNEDCYALFMFSVLCWIYTIYLYIICIYTKILVYTKFLQIEEEIPYINFFLVKLCASTKFQQIEEDVV